MDWKNILLVFIAGLNFALALVVYLRNPKNRINIAYSLFVLSVSLWVLGLAIFRLMSTMTMIEYLVFAYYAAAGLIPVFFYIFSIYFPYQLEHISLKNKVFTWLGAVFIVLISLPVFLVNSIVLEPPDNIVNLNIFGNIIYGSIFLIFTFLAFKNLINKFIASSGFQRFQLKTVIYGTIVAYFFGILFDLVYPLFGNYKMIWLGPCFTVVMIIYISNLLFFTPKKF